MRPTIKDVAKLTNVSIATVSNVLTNKKYVSPELKEKIQEAMEHLGYEPNITARNLKVNKTYKVGVVVPDITNPFFCGIVKYIEKTISASGYQLVLYNSDEKPEKELQIFESLLLGSVDGLILVASRMNELLMARKYQMPVVILDRPAFDTDADIHFVYSDDFKGAELIADLFLKKGYQNFVCITEPDDVQFANAKLNGFKNALLNNGIQSENIETYRTAINFDDCYSIMMDLLRNYDPEKKKGIFVCGDIGAWGAIEAVKKRGLKIPRDIGIAGFYDICFLRLVCPGLTTVQNPTKELGESAARVILNKLNDNGNNVEKTIVLDVKLIERETV